MRFGPPTPLESHMMLMGAGPSSGGGAFSPLDLSPSAWWDASQIVGLSNGDPIDTCPDSSGNSKDATGVTTGRPTYAASAINGKPAMLFDAVDDKLIFASITMQEAFIVCNSLDGVNFTDFRGALTFASATSAFRADQSTNDWRSNGGADGVFGTDMYVNGVNTKDFGTLSNFAISHGFAGSSITLAGEIGHDLGDAGRFWNGNIAEIVCFPSPLSNGDRVLMKNYLAAKYNITVS